MVRVRHIAADRLLPLLSLPSDYFPLSFNFISFSMSFPSGSFPPSSTYVSSLCLSLFLYPHLSLPWFLHSLSLFPLFPLVSLPIIFDLCFSLLNLSLCLPPYVSTPCLLSFSSISLLSSLLSSLPSTSPLCLFSPLSLSINLPLYDNANGIII